MRFLSRNREIGYDNAIQTARDRAAEFQEEDDMILADKIITLRKKAGWSQEELASQLGVTRQSVSKWEGAQSVPDLDKVVQMSRLFGVSTDYLLKDELEEEEFVGSEAEETPLRRVTMEQAARYLALRKACAPKIALAVAMCIVSPVVIIFLAALADAGLGGISEDLAAGLGVSVILVLVAIAVGMFLSCGAKTKEFDFLEKEPFETEYGVSGMVRERRKAYEPTASRCTILGVVLCILAVVPLMLGVGLASSDVAALLVRVAPADVYAAAAVDALLLLVACGVGVLVWSGTYTGAMDQLLEEGDYTRKKKARSGVMSTVSLIYWLSVTAIFLFYTFGPKGNGQPQYSWFIWAVGGVLYAAVMGIVSLVLYHKDIRNGCKKKRGRTLCSILNT